MSDLKRVVSSSPVKEAEVTTKREIWAWWLYMAAIEPISVVVLQLFLPLLTGELPALVGHVAGKPGVHCTGQADENCVLFELGGFQISGTTFSYAVITLSVALQAIFFVCFGALADYGSLRRTLLAITTALGSLFCVAVLLIRGTFSTIIAGSLAVLITIAFGASIMFYNSYLPLLAANHPETLDFRSDDPLEVSRRREVVSSDLSTKSFMLGYGSAIVVLVLCAAYPILFGSSSFSVLQYMIAFCGLIWGLGSIYPLMNLKPRAGPSLPEDASYWTFSSLKTLATVRKFDRLPHTFKYLLAYFLFADGCNTLGQVAVLFARDVLKAPYSTLIVCAILAPFCGVLGNFFFFYVQKTFKISTKVMLLWILLGFTILTAYGGAGVFTTAFGLHHLWETYVFAVCYGFLMGAMQSFSRVIFGELIPPGEEAEFFSLYAITDKGSSWLGPLIQALVSQLLPDQRYGLFFLGLMVLTPIPLLVWGVDLGEGKDDAVRFSRIHSGRSSMGVQSDHEMQEK